MRNYTTRSIAVATALITSAPASYGQQAVHGSDRITAGVIARELRTMGYSAQIDKDDSGDPRVETKVDDYNWSIYFYSCDKEGDLDARTCESYQFYSGYTVPKAFSLAKINKWNTEKRYAKAYTYMQRDKTNNARIEIDVLTEGTGADLAQNFRSNFAKMKSMSDDFRKYIGFK